MTVVAFTMLGIRFLRSRETEREEAAEAQRAPSTNAWRWWPNVNVWPAMSMTSSAIR